MLIPFQFGDAIDQPERDIHLLVYHKGFAVFVEDLYQIDHIAACARNLDGVVLSLDFAALDRNNRAIRRVTATNGSRPGLV